MNIVHRPEWWLSSPSSPNLNNLDNFAHNGGIKTKCDTARRSRRDLRIYICDRFTHWNVGWLGKVLATEGGKRDS